MKSKRRKSKIKLETLLRLSKKAAMECRKIGKIIDPEDGAQEYALRLLEGKHKKATVSQAVIDMHREVLNTRSKHHREQRALLIPRDPDEFDVSFDDSERIDARIFLADAVALLPEKQGMVVKYYLEGYTVDEIGPKLGVTKQRAHQIFQASVESLKKLSRRYRLKQSVA